jgi:hypothetical protein
MATMTPLPQLQPMADPMEQYGRVVALKSMLQQQQMQQQQMAYEQQAQPLRLQQQQNLLQQQQYELGRQKAINDAMKGAYTMNPDTGQPELDVPKASQTLSQAGYGEAVPGIVDAHTKMLQGMATLKETQGKVADLERDTAGYIGYTAQQSGYDPAILMHSLQTVQPQYPNEITPLIQRLQQNPTKETAQAIADPLMSSSPKVQEMLSQRYRATAAEWKLQDGVLVNTRTQEKIQPIGGMLPVQPDIAQAIGRPDLANQMVPAETLKKMKDAADAGLGFTQGGGRDLLVDKVTGEVKKDLGAATPMVTMGMQLAQGNLPQQALDQQTDRYIQTGQLPGLRGPGGQQLNKQIMINAANKYPTLQLAPNSAEWKANQASLVSLQKQYDQAMAFENVAQKNFNLAQNLAQKIPDIGTRIGNVAVRNVTSSMIGPQNLAAFNAAIDVASKEAAKVLSSATGTGQLTDTQQRDLQAIVDKNLPYNSMVAVFDTLRQDMNNRRTGYLDQMNDIKGRLAVPPGGAGGGGAGQTQHFVVNGKGYDIPANQVPEFKKDMNIK